MIRCAFYPHARGPEAAGVARMAAEHEYRCVVASGSADVAVLDEDMLAVDPSATLVTSVKRAEDGRGIIMRGYEPSGNAVPLQLGGRLAGLRRIPVDFLERPVAADVTMLRPHQVFTLRLE